LELKQREQELRAHNSNNNNSNSTKFNLTSSIDESNDLTNDSNKKDMNSPKSSNQIQETVRKDDLSA
jgi:hypothetical protein